MPVTGGIRRRASADHAARACKVLDKEVLAEAFGQVLCDKCSEVFPVTRGHLGPMIEGDGEYDASYRANAVRALEDNRE